RRRVRTTGTRSRDSERRGRDASGSRRAREQSSPSTLDVGATFPRGGERMSIEIVPERRARLTEYVPWILRDYFTSQGPSTALVLLLIGFLTLLPIVHGLTPEHASV